MSYAFDPSSRPSPSDPHLKRCVGCGEVKDRLRDFRPRWGKCAHHRETTKRGEKVEGCLDCVEARNSATRQPRCIACDAERARARSRSGGARAVAPAAPSLTMQIIDRMQAALPSDQLVDELVEAGANPEDVENRFFAILRVTEILQEGPMAEDDLVESVIGAGFPREVVEEVLDEVIVGRRDRTRR